jgi:hypothetical protein
MLGFIYVVLTAKPISIRRLCLLYVVLWASARCLLSILRVEPATSLTVAIATALTLTVWVSPLVRVLFGTLLGKRIAVEAFERVSACVQFTYGFVLVVLPMIAFETWLRASHVLSRVGLIPTLAYACITCAGFAVMIQRSKATKERKRCERSIPRSPRLFITASRVLSSLAIIRCQEVAYFVSH